MSYLHILLCIKNSKGFKSGNIWMDKLFSQNEGSDCLPPFFSFGLRFSSLSRIFHSCGVTGEGLQNLTYTRNSWTLISEGFERATPTVTRDIGIYFHLPVTLTTLTERWALELSLPVLRLVSFAAGIRKPNLPHARSPLSPTASPWSNNL